jgi:peptidoglycan/LPS O-acetylase OafA/YrhL
MLPQSTLAATTHVNNFDFLRLVFATFVLITHSYSLAGVPENDILWQLTDGQAGLSYMGLSGFFVISGYLITKSMIRNRDLVDYFFRRFLRLFPGLLCVLAITVVIGYFVSGKPLGAYLSHFTVRDYLIFNSILFTQYGIDGVFTTLPVKMVNGSLWSIPYEFLCYIILSSLFVFRKNQKAMRALLVGGFVIGLSVLFFLYEEVKQVPALPFFGYRLEILLPYLMFFIGGGVWALFTTPKDKVKVALVITSTVALTLSLSFQGVFPYLKFLLLPLLLIPFGELKFRAISWVRNYGDFSYGIYLWGFLVQQLLMHFLQPDYLSLMVLSIPLTYVAGALSWHLVEKRALRLKMKRVKLP